MITVRKYRTKLRQNETRRTGIKKTKRKKDYEVGGKEKKRDNKLERGRQK
jgi:hypothetical protein